MSRPDYGNDMVVSFRRSRDEAVRIHHVKVMGIQIFAWDGEKYSLCDELSIRQAQRIIAQWERLQRALIEPPVRLVKLQGAHVAMDRAETPRPNLRLIKGGKS